MNACTSLNTICRRGAAITVLTSFFIGMLAAQTAANWTQKFSQDSPTARNDLAMAYDSTHGQVVLFGGVENSDFSDTWEWDGSNWTQKTPQNSPSARDNHAVAYDFAHSQVVLFGGSNARNTFNDTWVWDGSNWTMQSPPSSPPARSNHAMAYDSAHGQVVLFGGVDSNNNYLNDTWVWDGFTWTRKSSPNSPSPRVNHKMVYDSAHSQVILFGGHGTNPFPLDKFNDTWVWDGSNWTQKFPNTNPPARAAFGLAYNSAQGQTVMFGGGDSNTFPNNKLNDTWVWDGSNWTMQSPQNSPSARASLAMAYDSAHSQIVLFGGSNVSDTWVYGAEPAPRISLGSRTITASGDTGHPSPDPPAYVDNPNTYGFALTDGITTLTGQERRSNDPIGGPNKDLQAMTGFDGRQAVVSGTINTLSLADTQVDTSSQFISIGLITLGAVEQAATDYNSDMGHTTAAGKDGFAGIKFLWTNDQNGAHLNLLVQDFDTQPDQIFLNLANLGLASGQSITQPITFSMTFNTTSMSLVVNGQSRGTISISHDFSSALLLVRVRSSHAGDGTATITYSNIVAATPASVGPPAVIYRVSGDNQTAPIATAVAAPIVVGVVDAYRNPVAGTTVNFTGTNATVNPATAQTDANGQASTEVTLGNTAGPGQVTAMTANLPPVSFNLIATVNATLPIINAVVNGASFVGGGVVAGEIASAFGNNLTSASGINLTSSLPLPTEFLNVSVIVNDPAAPLFAVDNVNGQQQINFQVPWELAGHANANIAVSNNGVTGATINVPVLAAQPGIFAYSVGGNSFGAILHANFQLADTGHPAMAGETVLIYCTGLGAVNTTPGDGVAGSGQTTAATPSVTMGGKNAAVSFSGLAPGFVGLYQINAVVPSGLASGNQPVIITMQGASSNSALLPTQ